MKKADPIRLRDQLSRARQLVAMLLRSSEAAREPGAELLEILEAVETNVLGSNQVEASATSRKQPTWYRVQDFDGRPVLEEFRPSNPHPFRCPKAVHDAAVAALSEASEWITFNTLLERVEAKLSERPADYHLRICLRLWQRSETPLIEKTRARYRPVRPEQFKAEAEQLWKRLAE